MVLCGCRVSPDPDGSGTRESQVKEVPSTLPASREERNLMVSDPQTLTYYSWLCIFSKVQRKAKQQEAVKKYGLIIPCPDDSETDHAQDAEQGSPGSK